MAYKPKNILCLLQSMLDCLKSGLINTKNGFCFLDSHPYQHTTNRHFTRNMATATQQVLGSFLMM